MLSDRFGSDIAKTIIYHLNNIAVSDFEIIVEDILCEVYGTKIAQIILMYVYCNDNCRCKACGIRRGL